MIAIENEHVVSQLATRRVGRIVMIEGYNQYGKKAEVRTSRAGGFWACIEDLPPVKLTGVEASVLCLEIVNSTDSGTEAKIFDLTPVIIALHKGVFSDWRVAASRVKSAG